MLKGIIEIKKKNTVEGINNKLNVTEQICDPEDKTVRKRERKKKTIRASRIKSNCKICK